MHGTPHQSHRAPAEWTGAPRLMEKWLGRRCVVESLINFLSGSTFLIFGLVALVLTSCITAGIVVFLLFEASALLASFGFSVSLLRPLLFGILFCLFLALSIAHAYRTRWGTETTAGVDLGTPFATSTALLWEFLSAGPILLILSGQDFYRYSRLSRLDVPYVSALLLWLYDKGGRAGFAEICLAFPGLNAVRVLPQLRDLPGIHWWPGDGEISLSDELQKTFAQLLGRPPKNAPFSSSSSRKRYHFQEPIPEVDRDIVAWYAALNLPLFAPLKQVKAQYRKLAKIHHPDARFGSRVGGETSDDEQMKRINEAYHNILKHSQGRAGVPH